MSQRSKWDRRPQDDDDAGIRRPAEPDDPHGLLRHPRLWSASRVVAAMLIWMLVVLVFLLLDLEGHLGAILTVVSLALGLVASLTAARAVERRRRRVLDLVAREGPLVHWEIAARLGVADSRRFRSHLARMARRGLLHRTEAGYVIASAP